MTQGAKITGTIFKKEYYDNAFQEIEKLPDSLSPEEVCLEIYKRMDLSMLIVHMASRSMLESIELFRLRIPSGDEKFDESKIQSYYYRPDIENIKMSRANLAQQQVFYASFDGNTPFHELSSQIIPNRTVCYLSIWGLRNVPEITNIRNLFLGIPPGIENNLASLMAAGLTEKVEKIMSQIPGEARELFLYGQKKYSELFTYPQEYYHLTSAIANDTFVTSQNQGASMPILTYPSVAKNKSSVNVAIRKDFADTHLFLKEVYKVVLTELGDEVCKIKVEKRGKVSEGTIVWSQPKIEFKIKGVFSSDDGSLQNMKSLGKDESFSLCCVEHKFNFDRLREVVKISDEKIIDALSVTPLDLYTDFPQNYRCFMPIKVGRKVYKANDISESGLIKYIILGIEFSIGFCEIK